MQYREDKYGNKLSVLGFGCMRFTTKLGKLDFEKAEKEIMTAYNNGVNYFDTAYIYPGSEALVGEIFEKNGIRDQVNIATKLPHYLVKKREDFDKIFDEELKRLRTDHVDYYLMHMLSDVDAWKRLCDLGAIEWIREKKQKGQIRQIGFSYHGNSDMFCRLIDSYEWEFCMIQYNYMDEHSQAGRKGLTYANQRGLPVFIMEPLRGGSLVRRLPEEVKKLFAHHEKQYSPAQWSFRWLWNQPEVTVVLSGMNSVDMVIDNVETASSSHVGDLLPEDEAMLKKAVEIIRRKMKVPCTGCSYCVPCPKQVDIPGIFAAYNRRFTEGKFRALTDYFMCTTLRQNSTAASNCVGCGKCKSHCPQGIDIPKELETVQKDMEGTIYKIAKSLVKKIAKF